MWGEGGEGGRERMCVHACVVIYRPIQIDNEKAISWFEYGFNRNPGEE
jgi:hypothetical protein